MNFLNYAPSGSMSRAPPLSGQKQQNIQSLIPNALLNVSSTRSPASTVRFKPPESSTFATSASNPPASASFSLGEYNRSANLPSPPQPESQSAGYRERIIQFYKRYAPEKVTGVDALMEKYPGNEEGIIEGLIKKYGPEPSNSQQNTSRSGQARFTGEPHSPRPPTNDVESQRKYSIVMTKGLEDKSPDDNTQNSALSSRRRSSIASNQPGRRRLRVRRISRVASLALSDSDSEPTQTRNSSIHEVMPLANTSGLKDKDVSENLSTAKTSKKIIETKEKKVKESSPVVLESNNPSEKSNAALSDKKVKGKKDKLRGRLKDFCVSSSSNSSSDRSSSPSSSTVNAGAPERESFNQEKVTSSPLSSATDSPVRQSSENVVQQKNPLSLIDPNMIESELNSSSKGDGDPFVHSQRPNEVSVSSSGLMLTHEDSEADSFKTPSESLKRDNSSERVNMTVPADSAAPIVTPLKMPFLGQFFSFSSPEKQEFVAGNNEAGQDTFTSAEASRPNTASVAPVEKVTKSEQQELDLSLPLKSKEDLREEIDKEDNEIKTIALLNFPKQSEKASGNVVTKRPSSICSEARKSTANLKPRNSVSIEKLSATKVKKEILSLPEAPRASRTAVNEKPIKNFICLNKNRIRKMEEAVSGVAKPKSISGARPGDSIIVGPERHPETQLIRSAQLDNSQLLWPLRPYEPPQPFISSSWRFDMSRSPKGCPRARAHGTVLNNSNHDDFSDETIKAKKTWRVSQPTEEILRPLEGNRRSQIAVVDRDDFVPRKVPPNSYSQRSNSFSKSTFQAGRTVFYRSQQRIAGPVVELPFKDSSWSPLRSPDICPREACGSAWAKPSESSRLHRELLQNAIIPSETLNSPCRETEDSIFFYPREKRGLKSVIRYDKGSHEVTKTVSHVPTSKAFVEHQREVSKRLATPKTLYVGLKKF